jgi:hypothetical protein
MFLKKNKLDFLVIGVQKAGTTALYHYFDKHPDIFVPETKELHYFDNDAIFKDKVDYKKLHGNFKNAKGKQIKGEVTPIYFYWNNCIDRIKEYNPSIKLIVILRNPISRAYSQWNMEVLRGNETRSFSDCINDEMNKISNGVYKQHRIKSYVDRGNYSCQIENLFSKFNRKNLLFIKYEDFLNNQGTELNNIFSFLGIDSNIIDFEKKEEHNLKYSSKMTKEDYNVLLKYFLNDIEKVEALLDWNCLDWKK